MNPSEIDAQAIVSSYPTYEVSEKEKLNMLYMWEEEKLARDVYLASYDSWGHRVFNNISSSEQKHMNAVHTLLEKYNIDVSVDPNERGRFSIPELQRLYDTLASRSKVSLTEAFRVGKEIEELDINDLTKIIKEARPDASAIYSNLLQGSYRHLNAFNRQLGF